MIQLDEIVSMTEFSPEQAIFDSSQLPPLPGSSSKSNCMHSDFRKK